MLTRSWPVTQRCSPVPGFKYLGKEDTAGENSRMWPKVVVAMRLQVPMQAGHVAMWARVAGETYYVVMSKPYV